MLYNLQVQKYAENTADFLSKMYLYNYSVVCRGTAFICPVYTDKVYIDYRL